MIKHKIDLAKGKAIYYKYKGDKFGISKDLGEEYNKCHIPKEIEQEWKEDIICALINDIKNETGSLRIDAFMAFVQIVSIDDALSCIFEILNSNSLDTFSTILICEYLKRFIEESRQFLITDEQKKYIRQLLERKKSELLSSQITIDSSFKLLPYMKNYDFSEESIVSRIQNL